MNNSLLIAALIALILVEGFVSSLKKFYWGLIIPIACLITNFFIHDILMNQLLLWTTVTYALVRVVVFIVRKVLFNKKVSELNRLKIKDLG